MVFSKLNFIIPLNSNDKVLKIRNSSGMVVNIIKDPSCTLKQDGINIYIKQTAESNPIILNFSTTDEAKAAHIILRNNLLILDTNLGISPDGPTVNPGPINPNDIPYDNCDPNRDQVLLHDIWSQSDLIPYTAPSNSAGVVQVFKDLSLIWSNGTKYFAHPNFVDIIPYYYGDGSYHFILKTHDDIIIPDGWQNWKVDLTCGRIYFNSGFVSTGSIIVDSTHPPKISFCKYIGTKGILTSSGVSILKTSINPPATTIGVDANFNVPVAIQNIIGLYLNGQLIENIINVSYILNSSSTAPTTITWKGTADFILETDDIITIQYN